MKTVTLLFSALLTFLSVLNIGKVKFSSNEECCNETRSAIVKRSRFNPKAVLDSTTMAAMKRLDRKIAKAKGV